MMVGGNRRGFATFGESLICAVRSRPVLWQPSQKDFKNTNVTDRLWDEVGRETKPSYSGPEVKDKWKNLKDSLRRKLHKLSAAKTNAARQRITKWCHFEEMSFMRDQMLRSFETSEGSFPESGLQDIQTQDTPTTDDWKVFDSIRAQTDNVTANSSQEQSLSDSPTPSSGISTPPPPPPTPPLVAEQRRRPRPRQRRHNRSKAKTFNLSRLRATEADNGDMQFFRSLLPFLTSLTEIEKLELRTEIQQLILNKLKSKQKPTSWIQVKEEGEGDGEGEGEHEFRF